MSTIIVLNINAPNYSRFLTKAEQLSQTFAVISDDAVYSGTLIACKVDIKSINCSRYDDGEWQDVDLRKIMSWGWPDGIIVKQVLVNGVPVRENQKINFAPSGDNETLAIEITDNIYSIWIYGDLTGKYWVSS